MDGFLNIYKQKGPTSHDVVDELRHIFKMKRIGHAGTLDPEAEGVLPVCLGKATKFSSMLSDFGKAYRAVMLLGITTDTQDLTGQVTEEHPVSVTEDELSYVIAGFIGTYDQIPPMYSARKVNGEKLYKLAREGKEVERQPKRVDIESITIDDISLPRVTMTIVCSKGTYIRTLCHDIGQKLGCGACMESLLRTRAGGFRVEEALTLSEIAGLDEQGTLHTAVISPDAVFMDHPAMRALAGSVADKFLHNGNPVSERFLEADGASEPEPGIVRMYDSPGRFIGIYRYDPGKKDYEPVTVLI